MSDYMVQILLEKIEALEKRVSELEKGTSSKSDWYDDFVEVVGEYVSRDISPWTGSIITLAGQVHHDICPEKIGHVRVATQLMLGDDSGKKAKEVYYELKKAR